MKTAMNILIILVIAILIYTFMMAVVPSKEKPLQPTTVQPIIPTRINADTVIVQ